VLPSGMRTLMPGDAMVLLYIGALSSKKCPVAPVSAIILDW
jgi:hypothetical protein